jgi:hypothetical protein
MFRSTHDGDVGTFIPLLQRTCGLQRIRAKIQGRCYFLIQGRVRLQFNPEAFICAIRNGPYKSSNARGYLASAGKRRPSKSARSAPIT